MDPKDTGDSRPDDPEGSASERPPLKRSRSSYDKDLITKVAAADTTATTQASGSGEESVVFRRRPSDTLDYPRRRAIIACEICRSRKSRCDGTRPKCRLCQELNAECIYREPGIKLDAGDKLILEQLSRIENILSTNLVSPTSATMPASLAPMSPATSVGNTGPTVDDSILKRFAATTGVAGVLPQHPQGSWSNISTMPKNHTTPALHLLQWPVIKDLVSGPFEPQILLQAEMARAALDLVPHFSVDFTNVMPYVRAYFEKVNVWYAFVNPFVWRSHYRLAVSQGFRSGVDSCICLLVFALGQAAHCNQSIFCVPQGQKPPGMSYFAAAWKILPTLLIRNDVLSAQCHMLAAAYLLYLVRPLEAWNLLHTASSKLQLVLSLPSTIPPQLSELTNRLFWNSIMIESDLLAELDLPHSGIVQFEESMRLPRSFPCDAVTPGASEEPPGNDELWYFLAEIALRRLLNRVSHLLYTGSRTTPVSISAIEGVAAELDYQLSQWYEGLPGPVKFPRERLPAHNSIQTVLRLRYFACRTIIFRPYIQAVLADESVANEQGVQEACRKCLEACVRQLEQITAHHEGHLPYLWQGALSILSQTLLIMGATLNNSLASLLPPAHQMDVIINEVVNELDRQAHLAPSLQISAGIIREAEQRRQTLAKGSNH